MRMIRKMKIIAQYMLFLAFIFLVNAVNFERLTLVQVQVYVRHGARTPLKDFSEFLQPANWQNVMGKIPLPEYKVLDFNGIQIDVRSNKEKEQRKFIIRNVLQTYKAADGTEKSIFVGQLTDIGKEQEYHLGQELAKDYGGILFSERKFKPTQFYVRSTNTERTRDSAAAIIAGIFGGAKNVKGLIIHVVEDIEMDPLNFDYGNCSALSKEREAAFKKYVKGNKIFAEIAQKTCKENGFTGNKLSSCLRQLDTNYIYGDFICRLVNNIHIPSNIVKEMPYMEKATNSYWYRMTCGLPGRENLILPLSCGVTYNNLINSMENSIKGKIGPHFLIFSVHDTTLKPLMETLGIYRDKWPSFASNIRYELYKSREKEYFVRVLYNGKPCIIGGGDGPCKQELFCPLNKFIKTVQSIRKTPEQRARECNI